METLNRIKELIEKMSMETHKVYSKNNRSASVRARKYAQEVKFLISLYRKEILEQVKKYDTGN